ncbi:cobalamin-binding protein [Flocculibacter collagenilyticus]|uniref:cobalamin-binding protein n=1 Tax=Flocculibacter collagenilyticus TaxID=2744479 RepID=UPI0018F363DF|nr:cobalamin-binding protein [Flocculibacter collagenilyticus]
MLKYSVLSTLLALVISVCIPFNDVNASELTEHEHKQRIVALSPHIVEMLFEIGAGDHIVATVDYADFPEQALSIPKVGGFYGVQIEKIIALQPDLVIAWKTGNQDSDIAKLQQFGIKVVFSQPKQLTDIANEFNMLGKLTGHQVEATQKAKAYLTLLNQITRDYESKQSLPSFYQLWSEPMMTINRNTWIHQLMQRCGASNVFAQNTADYPQISIENVMLAQPQLIIIPDERTDKPQPTINWQQWPEIPAVKHQRFISVNADLLHRFSFRMLDGLADMCQQIDNVRKTINAVNQQQ